MTVQPAESANRRYNALLMGLVWLAICTVVLCLMVASAYSHDEEQYAAAGTAAMRGMIYRDFVYLQPPVYPMVLAAAFSLAHGDIYLASHAVSALATLGCCGLAYVILRTLGVGALVASLGAFALLCSTTMQLAVGSARNDVAPLVLFLAGLLAAVRAWRAPAGERTGRAPLVLLLVAGLAMGLSVSTKLTYVFAAPLLGAYALLARRPWRASRVLTEASAVGAGGLIGLSPTLLSLAAFPVQATYGMFQYHMTAPRYFYTLTGQAKSLTLPFKLTFTAKLLYHEPMLASCLALFCLAAWVRVSRQQPAIAWPRLLVLLIILLVGAAVMASMPNPPQQTYWLAPATLAILLAAALTATLQGRLPTWVLVIAWLPGALGGARAMSRLWPSLHRPQNWTTAKVMRASRTIRAAQLQAHVLGPIATLEPIYVLDAGGQILPELVSGPFVFRSGATVSAQTLHTLHALSPAILAADLDARKVAGVYVGHERSFLGGRVNPEQPLQAYASARGFVRAPGVVDGLLLLRPTASPPQR